jgi:hypothetical protein
LAVAGLLGTVAGGPCPPSRAGEPGSTPSFLNEVQANFKAWDLDGDGTLSFDETTRLVPRTAFRDTSAAALAAVHLAQRRPPRPKGPYPREVLVAAPPHRPGGRPPFEFYFAEGLAHIRETDRTLFAEGAPNLATIRQGPLGDCYFVATLGALVHRRPKDVERIVEQAPDGSFQVRFPNGESLRIHHVTDSELALGSFAAGQGVWLNVLEKAYGELIERSLARQGVVENAIDALGDGGRPTAAITLLTGNDAGLLRFRPEDSDAAPSARRVEGFIPRARALLVTNLRRGLLTCCATSKGDVPPGMAPQHLYAVLDFDADRDVVQLWNPWGHFFEPRGEAGLAAGYPVRGGRFAVPLADFIRIFDAVIYEAEGAEPY